MVERVPAPAGIDVRFVARPWLRAGDYAHNAWLNELPRPLTKMIWGNAALVAPGTARAPDARNRRSL